MREGKRERVCWADGQSWRSVAGMNFSKLHVFTCVFSVFISAFLTDAEHVRRIGEVSPRRYKQHRRKNLTGDSRVKQSIDPRAAECLFNYLRCYELM